MGDGEVVRNDIFSGHLQGHEEVNPAAEPRAARARAEGGCVNRHPSGAILALLYERDQKRVLPQNAVPRSQPHYSTTHIAR